MQNLCQFPLSSGFCIQIVKFRSNAFCVLFISRLIKFMICSMLQCSFATILLNQIVHVELLSALSKVILIFMSPPPQCFNEQENMLLDTYWYTFRKLETGKLKSFPWKSQWKLEKSVQAGTVLRSAWSNCELVDVAFYSWWPN